MPKGRDSDLEEGAMRALFTILAVGLFCPIALVQATPITYLMTTTATGTLGGTPFTDALFTVTLAGDTSGVVSGPSPFTAFLVNPGNATVNIAGLGAAAFTDQMVFASTYNSSLKGETAVLVVDNATGTAVSATTGASFFGYNPANPFGPITGGGGIGNGGGPGNTFPTTAGTLTFATGQENRGSIFTAVNTQTLTGYQGGTIAAPRSLITSTSLAAVTSTIGNPGLQDYYSFLWPGG